MLSKGIKISSIISDETMPFLKGSSSAQILGQILFNLHTPKIAFYLLTAYEDSQTLNALKNSHMDFIYSKPLKNNCAEFILNGLSNK